jgi:Tfp pilus assembly protein PilO
VISFERVFREKRSLMLPLLIAVLVNVALLVLVVLPLTRSVAAEEARAIRAAQARQDAQMAFARAEAIVKGKARADQELTRFYGQVLPANSSGARAITFSTIQQLATKAGLKVGNQTWSIREPEEIGELTKYATDLVLTGNYRGIRQFIYAVETQPAFLVLESVELKQEAGQGEPLSVLVRLATYYRTPHDR